MDTLLIIIISITLFIGLGRLLYPWLLRITDIITLLTAILDELKELNNEDEVTIPEIKFIDRDKPMDIPYNPNPQPLSDPIMRFDLNHNIDDI